MPYSDLFEKNKYTVNHNTINHSLCILGCGLLFFIDLVTKLGYYATAPNVIVIMLAAMHGTKNKILFYAGLSTVLVIVGFYLSPSIDIPSSVAIANRTIGIAILWIVTIFCIIYLNSKKALEIEKQNISLVFNATPGALLMVNQEDKIELVNKTLCELFGYDRDELIGQRIEILIPYKFWQNHGQHREGYNKKPEKRTMAERADLHAHTKDGRKFPVEIDLNPVKLNQVPKVIALVTDITERRKQLDALQDYMSQLKKSNESLEQFAYVASHDLQEPLRMVSSYTQLLASRYQNKLGDDADEFIKYAVDGAKRMQSLIQDLLRFSRLSAESIKKEQIDINELYDYALDNLKMTISDTSTQITKDELPVIFGDKGQLGQLFQNLIGNAIKYGDPEINNQVHVSAERVNDMWQFCVQDNGIGIQPEYFERIFVIFKRLHGAHEYTGTGIGLALCKRIVDSHGGEIWVESEYGKGSRFYFSLLA